MTALNEIESRVRGFIEAQIPALPGARCVLAASGGADSTSTVAALCEIGVLAAPRCVVAHFDHGLRDEEAAARDRAAVESVCMRYGLDLVCDTWTSPRASEAPARDARYAFLARVALNVGAVGVITGHTADDQAETVLMHAMRGAGLHGLAGMAADTQFPAGTPLRLWRPLLDVARAETRDYCDARGLSYHDDATNDDRAFLRNRMRIDVLPSMERRAPGTRDALLRLAAASRATASAIDAIAATAMPPAPADGEFAVSRDALRALPAEALPSAFRLAAAQLLGDARDFERRHYAILGATLNASTGSTFELPRGVIVTVDAEEIVFSLGTPQVAVIPADLERPLPFTGIVGAWRLDVRPADDSPDALLFPPAAVVRRRRPGDRLRPRGMAGHKKLQDHYTDRKVPRRLRDAVPVIACGDDVLWTPFGRCESADAGRRYAIEATCQ